MLLDLGKVFLKLNASSASRSGAAPVRNWRLTVNRFNNYFKVL
jgi:hypothetical protein